VAGVVNESPRQIHLNVCVIAGLFREEYEGSTLREHYGLKRPVNKYAEPVAV
jgi:hypothetical protein